MPFPVDQIEALFSEHNILPKDFPAQYAPFLQQNRKLVTDYLTGRTNILSGLQQDHSTHTLFTLVRLLGPLDTPTPNDQLVLDVLLDPAVFSSTQEVVFSVLAHQCLEINTPAIFHTAASILTQKGLPPSTLFSRFMIMMTAISADEWKNIPAASPLKQYLVANIPTTILEFVHNNPGGRNSLFYAHAVDFNRAGFFLLEEQQPERLIDFIKFYIDKDAPQLSPFLTGYKDGKYLPLVEQVLEAPADSTEEFQKKVAAAVRLIRTDKERHRDYALRAAANYLTHIKSAVPEWEQRAQVEELRDICNSNYVSFSSISWYILLQYDIPQALSLAAEWSKAGNPLNEQSLILFHKYAGRQSLPVLLAAIDPAAASFPSPQAIALLVGHFDPASYLSLFWQLLGHKSKAIRHLIIPHLAEKDPAAESKAIPLLKHKKADMRQSAASLLSILGSPAAKAAMMEALNKETNDAARDILLETIADSLPEHTDRPWVDQLIENAAGRNKLNKPLPFIQDEASLPELYYMSAKKSTHVSSHISAEKTDDDANHISGEKLDTRAIRFLLYRMSRSKGFNSDIEARYLLRLIDRSTSAPFANALFKIFIDGGAVPDEKHLLFTAALLGDDSTASSIRRFVEQLIESSRFKMAEHAVGALAIQGSDKALRGVEWFSRKYAVKKANVGAAATAALEAAATELDITIYELGDRIVPDFGFDGLFRNFEAGGEEYRAFIDSRFKLAFFNDANKKLKSLPASAPAELKEEFKSIAKEIRDIVKSQSPRLEYYLVIQRKWPFPQWRKFFLGNPVMFIYATRLLWGVYKDREGAPVLTFLCDEDTTLYDQAGEELTPDDNWNIGIVHPTQLDPATLRHWQQQFFDRNIEPVFPQLDRRQASLEGIDLSKSIIRKFENRKMTTGSIRSTLDRLGWRKGPTGDGGMIGTYHLIHDERKIEAVLEIEGVGAGFGWTGDERTGRLYFAHKGAGRKNWWYSPQNDADEHLVPLDKVPTLFLHETLAAVEAIKPDENGQNAEQT